MFRSPYEAIHILCWGLLNSHPVNLRVGGEDSSRVDWGVSHDIV